MNQTRQKILIKIATEKLGQNEFDRGWKLCNMIEILIAIYMQVIPGFSAFLFLLLKNKPWYYYRFLPKSLNYCGISTILYALYDYWSIAVHLAAFGLQVWVIIVFVHTVTVSLKFLRLVQTRNCKKIKIKTKIYIFQNFHNLVGNFLLKSFCDIKF